MGERIRIGIFFNYNENWIGGVYYILNLIEALKLLPEDQQPEISIFYSSEKDLASVRRIGYPHIKYVLLENNMQLPRRLIRVIARKLLRLQLFNPSIRNKVPRNYYSAIFPSPLVFDKKISRKKIYWIPDFQEAWLPQFFSEKEIALRKSVQQRIAHSPDHVIFSSYDAQKDFMRLYPGSTVKQHILQFATSHPQGYESIDFGQLQEKYQLPAGYFFCPNQFWVHKNQLLVLQAIKKLRDEFSRNIVVVFSGKQFDQRNKDYSTSILEYIDQHALSPNVRILGFIDRGEQLRIMKEAIAVIQPSLFEGWSTVVEDVKAMDQQIIASGIGVHREQLGENGIYFDPADSDTLVRAILEFTPKQVNYQYHKRRLKFAADFLNLVCSE